MRRWELIWIKTRAWGVSSGPLGVMDYLLTTEQAGKLWADSGQGNMSGLIGQPVPWFPLPWQLPASQLPE